MTPFQTFSVFPSYGHSQAAVSWTLGAGITGAVYIYRSLSGLPGTWTLLNPDTPVYAPTAEYLDFTPPPDVFTFVYYRGMVDGGGEPETWLAGPAVTALDTLEKSEYFLAREILRREYYAMARKGGNGVRAFHLVPKWAGDAAPNTDLETKQILGPPCQEDVNSGFGTPFVGGFMPPVQTWVRIIAMGGESRRYRPDAMGIDPSADLKLRLLAFPKPDEGHLIVLPEHDRRYVLKAPIDPFYLRGVVPIAWEATAEILLRGDVRHTIHVPGMRRDPH